MYSHFSPIKKYIQVKKKKKGGKQLVIKSLSQ